jgi:hypothetical protein
MSADEGSEYDDDIQDQEEILIDNEADGNDGRMDLEEDGTGEDGPRMKINQVRNPNPENRRPHLRNLHLRRRRPHFGKSS